MKNLIARCLSVWLLVIVSATAQTQTTDSALLVQSPAPPGEVVYNEPPTISEVQAYTGPEQVMVSNLEYNLGIVVLCFTFAVLSLIGILVFFEKLNKDKGFLALSITLIIGSSLYLITAGYAAEQIAPVTGLLGTIAGYLLGNSSIANNE